MPAGAIGGVELVVVLEELSDGDGAVDVEAPGAEVDGVEDAPVAAPVVVDVVSCAGVEEDALIAALPGVDVAICAGVEVEEINGGAFSMYELSGCTA